MKCISNYTNISIYPLIVLKVFLFLLLFSKIQTSAKDSIFPKAISVSV